MTSVLYSCKSLLHTNPCNCDGAVILNYRGYWGISGAVGEGTVLYVHSVGDVPVCIYSHNDNIDNLLHQTIYSTGRVYSTTVYGDCPFSN